MPWSAEPKSVSITAQSSAIWKNHKQFQLYMGSQFCSEWSASLPPSIKKLRTHDGTDTINVGGFPPWHKASTQMPRYLTVRKLA